MAAKVTTDFISGPRRKLALIIGIDEYDDGQNLYNAVNDASDISSALKRIGFIIGKPELNLKYEEMNTAVKLFTESIEREDMVLFYFAGHGTHWKVCKLVK
jgi:uncharacterized caspase-like protein